MTSWHKTEASPPSPRAEGAQKAGTQPNIYGDELLEHRLAQHGARKMLSIIRIAPYFLTRYPISTCVRQFSWNHQYITNYLCSTFDSGSALTPVEKDNITNCFLNIHVSLVSVMDQVQGLLFKRKPNVELMVKVGNPLAVERCCDMISQTGNRYAASSWYPTSLGAKLIALK
ncbi:hypothetical protein OUZ56_021322 [Daphnia magna]|uniref:Uncharacterized protein n=1 Tax=Daphnia magna TaxID=35525 RepID=A0ABQ9ZI29_9CRUS|nr:hypothetical protein OUZ56_021322 [Daphnia magna]